MNEVISVEGLGKKYIIGHEVSRRHDTFRDMIMNNVQQLGTFSKRLLNKQSASKQMTTEEFWALKNISFAIEQGERIGIIGRNGAGKSTLLKILSRITEPTTGSVRIKGRVASLLEVGTGFHPELSGRENIFLNGAILGMSRNEIKSKFDEIVDFAEIEKFLDTPVKRYSSGMYVRLAFAVAAHLEPEILIVDEVLAVGDAQFQKKCLGKMENVSRNDGRTILFVSHNLSSIKDICSKLIYLKKGEICMTGDVNHVISEYLSENNMVAKSGVIPDDFNRIQYHQGLALFRKVMVTDLYNNPLAEIPFREKFKIICELEVMKEVEDTIVTVIVSASSGEKVALLSENSNNNGYRFRSFSKGRHILEITVDTVLLPSIYNLTASIAFRHDGTSIDYVENVKSFTISSIALEKGRDYPWETVHGYFQPDSTWEYTKQTEYEFK